MPSKRIHRERLTRRELVEYLAENGYPISLHSLNRLCAPSCGEGPPLIGVWGGKGFYNPGRALVWARSRFGKNELRRSRGALVTAQKVVSGELSTQRHAKGGGFSSGLRRRF
jgi:hypothetical protein